MGKRAKEGPSVEVWVKMAVPAGGRTPVSPQGAGSEAKDPGFKRERTAPPLALDSP